MTINKEFGTVHLNTIPRLKKWPTTANAYRTRLMITELKLFTEKFLQISWVLFMMHRDCHVAKAF